MARSVGIMVLGFGSSQKPVPSFEHSLHTSSFAFSIMTLFGLPWILRPQTSHRNCVCTWVVFIIVVVFIVVEKQYAYLRCVLVEEALRRIRSVADYQFGKGVGAKLFSEGVKILYSRNTGRIRYVYLGSERLATMRPTDGLFSLSIAGARRLVQNTSLANCFVTVRDDVSRFIADGGDVFAAQVVRVDDDVHAKDEVVVRDEKGEVLAVGRAALSSEEMRAFKKGVAVKVRRGIKGES